MVRLLRLAWLVLLLQSCGGRTAYDSMAQGSATGGVSGAATATGGAAPLVDGGCPQVRFEVVSTPGYDTKWCLDPRSDSYKLLEVSSDAGPLVLQGRQLNCDHCNSGLPAPPSRSEYVSKDTTIIWSGVSHTVSSCSDLGTDCSTAHCTSAGRYVATVCGYVNPNPEWSGGCDEANDQTPVFCGATEFGYPAGAPVQVTLRPPAE
jgi:hypothetical protein